MFLLQIYLGRRGCFCLLLSLSWLPDVIYVRERKAVRDRSSSSFGAVAHPSSSSYFFPRSYLSISKYPLFLCDRFLLCIYRSRTCHGPATPCPLSYIDLSPIPRDSFPHINISVSDAVQRLLNAAINLIQLSHLWIIPKWQDYLSLSRFTKSTK